MSAIAAWSGFLSMQAEVAATLAGLIFVAVSFNMEKVLAYAAVGRAAEALILLVGVILICTVALAPGQTPFALGIEFLSIAVPLWLGPMAIHIRHRRRRLNQPWWWLGLRVGICQCATLSFLAAGALIVLAAPAALYWIIPGCVFSIIGAALNAWILLIEILR